MKSLCETGSTFWIGHAYFSIDMNCHLYFILFNMNSFQVISDKHLQIFTEEELERLLCGERDSWLVCALITCSSISFKLVKTFCYLLKELLWCFWQSGDLFDHIKFDHGYTAGSPPIINVPPLSSSCLNYVYEPNAFLLCNNELTPHVLDFSSWRLSLISPMSKGALFSSLWLVLPG